MRTIRATVAGKTYEIPAIWMVAQARIGRTAQQAVTYWHEQAEMETAFNASR